MDDAMTHRLLDVVNAELARCSRMRSYKRWAQCAALVLMGTLGIVYFSSSSAEGPPSEVLQSPTGNLSPQPQETYAGRDHRHYGVSIYGSCEYTACTDTL